VISEASDPVLQRLARLPFVEPDQARSDRLRSRCHAVLERRARRSREAEIGRPAGFAGRAVELALVAGFCLAYLAVVIRHAWTLFAGS
jgi:hypothetical protein